MASRDHPRLAPASIQAGPILIAVAVIAGLALGRDVLIPLVLAGLLSFILSLPVTRLRRLGLGRRLSVAVMALGTLTLMGGFVMLLTNQAIDLAANLPRYETSLRERVRSLGKAGGVIEQSADFLQRFDRELEAFGSGQPAGGKQPTVVRIEQPPASPVSTLIEAGEVLWGPLGMFGLVLLFMIFLLLQREDLRDRAIRLFAAQDVHRATAAMDDAGKRIGRYLLMQLIINLIFGGLLGAGLWFLGVPNALLWGLLGTLLRFVPFLGTVTSLAFPLLLSVAVAPSWVLPLLVLGLWLAVELACANVLEPLLYSSSTGLSPLAVIVAIMFWTVLWGPIGLLLATPLTACLVVLGRHVPALEFLAVALGNESALDPPVKLYQRLLAGDPQQPAEIAEAVFEKGGLQALYAQVLVPALQLVARDRQRNALDREQMREIVADIEVLAEDMALDAEGGTAPAPDEGGLVLCCGAGTSLDEAAAQMLARLLRAAGRRVEFLPGERLLALAGGERPPSPVGELCVVHLVQGSVRPARRLARRLRARLGEDLAILIVLPGADLAELGEVRAAAPRIEPLPGLPEAVARLRAPPRLTPPALPAPPVAGA